MSVTGRLRMTAPCGPTKARLRRSRVSPDQAVTPDRAATSARAPSRPWSRRLRHWTPLGPRPGSRACGRGDRGVLVCVQCPSTPPHGGCASGCS